jgi:hypothetical protein
MVRLVPGDLASARQNAAQDHDAGCRVWLRASALSAA